MKASQSKVGNKIGRISNSKSLCDSTAGKNEEHEIG